MQQNADSFNNKKKQIFKLLEYHRPCNDIYRQSKNDKQSKWKKYCLSKLKSILIMIEHTTFDIQNSELHKFLYTKVCTTSCSLHCVCSTHTHTRITSGWTNNREEPFN